jgi:exodeoxyribonuclease VII large subunit
MPEASTSLSELLQQVRDVLGASFPASYWIVAEIMEIHENRSGHCYLELIEKSGESDTLLARARGTIWAARYRMLRPYFESSSGTRLKSGIKLLFKASVEFHPQYGFSLNITDLDPAYTLGDLARKKQEVIRKLRESGVMEMNMELPFPQVPQHIAVISSDTAAGYGDFMDSLHRNHYGFRFFTSHYQAVMQGDEAPASIIRAMDRVFESATRFDCVALIRGGGSRADLECFNDYELAYYITQFPLPVLTGIGHERDESVADMVAAKGLKTPTAVAEFLVDRLLAFEFRLNELEEQLATEVRRTVQLHTSRLDSYRNDLRHLSRRFLQGRSEQLRQYRVLLDKAAGSLLNRQRDQLVLMEKRIQLVDPVRILARGYSMTLVEGKAIRDASGIEPGTLLETKLYRGSILSTATGISGGETEKKEVKPKNKKPSDGKTEDEL